MIYSVGTTFLLQNKILNSAICGWVIAQIIKMIISLIVGKFEKTRIVGTGGMPSSHTSTVIALTTSTFITCGYDSAMFAISLALAGIVMYDAMGIRRAAGKQAGVINFFKQNWNEELPDEHKKEMSELLGHTPFEVLAGVFVGVVVGILISSL